MLISVVFPRYIISNDPWRGPEVWALIGLMASISFKEYNSVTELK